MSEVIHKHPSDLAERFQVRMPEGLRDRLRHAAEANKRSMNAEIVARLEESFSTFGTVPPVPDLPERLAVFGGDIHALIASETIRLRELMERLEAKREAD